ncbi:MAG: hypothetical protein QOD10_4987 [Mycobacterium sp.]|jgi:hypothetical protein|nr:hypothetical protein [Mycobacterium sp.]
MGKATFRMVAATDGSPSSPSGYSYYLLAHAIATVLLLITLVAAIWEFMGWVTAPSCLGDASVPSVSSSPAAAPAGTNSPVALESVQVGIPNRTGVSFAASHHYSARAELALTHSECPCPQER